MHQALEVSVADGVQSMCERKETLEATRGLKYPECEVEPKVTVLKQKVPKLKSNPLMEWKKIIRSQSLTERGVTFACDKHSQCATSKIS